MGTRDPQMLRVRRLGIDTHQTPVVFMRADCAVCRSEGFEVYSQLQLELGESKILATLNIVHDSILEHGELGLSESAWLNLKPRAGDQVKVSHAPPLDSLGHVRSKIYGNSLNESAIEDIIRDIAAGFYSDIYLSAFIAACGGERLNLDEIVALTRAMLHSGEQLSWSQTPILDKHCVGGLPGNRTTPIVVAIAAACGLTIPKTSSRAITSPAGTADVMETITPVDLDIAQIRRVVELEGACLAWGGSARLSPADDILIRVERTLDIDSDGQLVASILSKKMAAGSTHVLIDIPVGPTAKVRTHAAAEKLSVTLKAVAARLGLTLSCLATDGEQPIGRGMGPALEARDVLTVLQNRPEAPQDLAERAILLSSRLLEMSGKFAMGTGQAVAIETLQKGRAWQKFVAICEAQGGLREPGVAGERRDIVAKNPGFVTALDCRRLSRLAKLAGAPRAATSGLYLRVRQGQKVAKGEVLFTLHAETQGELNYALEYHARNEDMIRVGDSS